MPERHVSFFSSHSSASSAPLPAHGPSGTAFAKLVVSTMCTDLVRLCDTPQHVHAMFCERRFTSDLIRRIRLWKWFGKPEKR